MSVYLTTRVTLAWPSPRFRLLRSGVCEYLLGALVAIRIDQWPFLKIGGAVILCLPWCLIVWLARRLNRPGPIFFGTSGAIITCATLSAVFAIVLTTDGTSLNQRLFSVIQREGGAELLFGYLAGLGYWRIIPTRVI